MAKPTCSQCQVSMKKVTKTRESVVGCLSLIVVFVVLLLVSLTGIGLIVTVPIGIIVLLSSPFWIFTETKHWKCPRCKVIIDRG